MARQRFLHTSRRAGTILVTMLLALAVASPTAVATGAPTAASASQSPTSFSLRFDTLPSDPSQGWTYFQSDGIPERSIFSVTGSSLIQNTIGTGEHNPNYAKFNVVDGTRPFVLIVRVQIQDYEGTQPFGFFFDVRTANPNQEYAIGLSPSRVQDPLGNGVDINTKDFHTYVLRGTPGGSYTLDIDGQFAFAGPFSATGGALNAVQFGDGAGLGPTNARAEVTRLEFSQDTTLGFDISSRVPKWTQAKDDGRTFLIVDTFKGVNPNRWAVRELSGARSNGLKTAAYFQLNFKSPLNGARQVQRALALLGGNPIAFMAVAVENVPTNFTLCQSLDCFAARNQRILEAVQELERCGVQPVIYTRDDNQVPFWRRVTGDSTLFSQMGIPLWDTENDKIPSLERFRGYGGWTERVGKQYDLGTGNGVSRYGIVADLDVFDRSLLSNGAVPHCV